MFNSLFARLSAVFLLIVILLGIALLYLSQSVSERYGLEVMQSLNRSVAGYINEQAQLLNNQLQVDEIVLDQLASHAMVLNPALEIYVLDLQGNILSHRLPTEVIQLTKVSLQPINSYLSNSIKLPILGDDPRSPDRQRVFSVSSIEVLGETMGYVYVVIGGQLYQDLRESVSGSYLYHAGGILMAISLVAASLVGCITFFFLTRRLRFLKRRIEQADLSFANLGSANKILELQIEEPFKSSDEVGQVAHALGKMANHIHQQYDALQSLDESRRELIANISHDLRTPLAALQGYIETLIIKNKYLTEQQRYEHLSTVIKHCQRLGNLITQLFELSRLESGVTTAKIEPFSLLELVYDCVQEFELKAKNKQVTLTVSQDADQSYVIADIGLIHRVLQNLVENALEHTHEGGKVTLNLKQTDKQLFVEVSDTGSGISTHELPYIFDRYYQANEREASEKIGMGLGLAIVKRILELHNTHIQVSTELNYGTSFSFSLPLSRVGSTLLPD